MRQLLCGLCARAVVVLAHAYAELTHLHATYLKIHKLPMTLTHSTSACTVGPQAVLRIACFATAQQYASERSASFPLWKWLTAKAHRRLARSTNFSGKTGRAPRETGERKDRAFGSDV